VYWMLIGSSASSSASRLHVFRLHTVARRQRLVPQKVARNARAPLAENYYSLEPRKMGSHFIDARQIVRVLKAGAVTSKRNPDWFTTYAISPAR